MTVRASNLKPQLKKGTPIVIRFSNGRTERGHITSDLMIGDFYSVMCESGRRALALPSEVVLAANEAEAVSALASMKGDYRTVNE